MLELLKSALFGVVEGITEWLPISSTGHLIILQRFLPLKISAEFYDVFEVVIQLGAILAVVMLYFEKIFPWKWDRDTFRVLADRQKISLWYKIFVACLPAAVIGILFDDLFNKLFYNHISVSIALIVFGIVFVIVEKYREIWKNKTDGAGEVTLQKAAWIGVFQVLAAIFPGTSRSGATIIGALLVGCGRVAATEFSFFLAIPVMLGASLLKILKFGVSFTLFECSVLIIGTLISFVVSMFVIRGLVGFVKKHDFRVFGWYRIVLGTVILLIHFLFENHF